MFKHFRALGIAGLTTLSASQLALAGPDNVLWSQHKENSEVIVSGIKVAARTISRLNQHRPLVRFTSNEVAARPWFLCCRMRRMTDARPILIRLHSTPGKAMRSGRILNS